MFHRKPLYVALAQRKEDRQAQLQLLYAQRMPGLVGHSTPVFPGGYPPYYYTPGVVQVPPRPVMMYQPLESRPGWRANGFFPPTRPALQPSPVSTHLFKSVMKLSLMYIFVLFYPMSYFKLWIILGEL